MSRAITTVGISSVRNFEPYHARFKQTIVDSGFGCAEMTVRWESEWPPSSPPQEKVHYAFKVHALKHVLSLGASSVLWLDVANYAVAPLEPLWQQIEREGHFFAGAGALGNWASDHCLAHFGMSRDEAMEIELFAGTCFGLDLKRDRSRKFLERLAAYAVPHHFNGTHKSSLRPGMPVPEREAEQMSDDPRCMGHRSDEPYMTLIARDLGMEYTPGFDIFTGGHPVKPTTVLRSGYNIAADGTWP